MKKLKARRKSDLPGLLKEIRIIKNAFRQVALIKAGKIKGRPAEELLKEL